MESINVMLKTDSNIDNYKIKFNEFKDKILKDYKLAVLSRECSLIGRKEVLSGKAKFGIFGDGKGVTTSRLKSLF